jgi:hypothetical protein
VITALGGANALVLSVLLLLGRVALGALQRAGSSIQPVLQDSFFWGLVWIVVAVVGLCSGRFDQAATIRSRKSEYVEGWG